MKKMFRIGNIVLLISCLWLIFSSSVMAQQLYTNNKMSVDQQGNSLSVSVILPNGEGYSDVYVPVWTENGGQNDIVWYSASLNENGTWSVTFDVGNHGYSSDIYNIHVYAADNTSALTFVAGTKVYVECKLSGDAVIVSQNEDYGTFRVQINNVSAPFHLNRILVPIWSESGGQDDIIWYTAKESNGKRTVDVDAYNHKLSTGVYQIHVYYEGTDGRLVFADATKTTVSMKALGKTKVSGSFDGNSEFLTITLKNYIGGGSIYVPVWTEKGGQDDICWYEAKCIDAYTWSVQVPISAHGYETGKYIYHVYAMAANGTLSMVNNGYTTITYKKTIPAVKVSALDESLGRYRMSVEQKNLKAGTNAVYFPVWSDENGQDDIVWYPAIKNDTFWYADFDAGRHHYDQGQYSIHCYADVSGSLQLVGNTTQDVQVVILSDGGLSPAVVAKSWIIYDQNNDRIVYAKNPDGVVQLASQTKVMTAMLVLEHVSDLNAPVTMTYSASGGMTWDTTRAGLVVGRQYTVQTLLEGLLVYSGGDCANLLAEYVAGSVPAFVQLMNEKAVELGMSSTKFSDPIGLYDNHSTPREYMKLASWADENPTLRSIVSMPRCTVADVTGAYVRNLGNTNYLLTGAVPHDYSAYIVDGMKTGFTDSAGYCLTATGYDSRYRYIAAIFGSNGNQQRAVDCRTLLDAVLIY